MNAPARLELPLPFRLTAAGYHQRARCTSVSRGEVMSQNPKNFLFGKSGHCVLAMIIEKRAARDDAFIWTNARRVPARAIVTPAACGINAEGLVLQRLAALVHLRAGAATFAGTTCGRALRPA